MVVILGVVVPKLACVELLLHSELRPASGVAKPCPSNHHYSETDDAYKDKKFNHELFWEWCKIKHSEGHRVFISEKNAPDGFRLIWEKELQVTHPRQRFKHTEKLFTIETNLR